MHKDGQAHIDHDRRSLNIFGRGKQGHDLLPEQTDPHQRRQTQHQIVAEEPLEELKGGLRPMFDPGVEDGRFAGNQERIGNQPHASFGQGIADRIDA